MVDVAHGDATADTIKAYYREVRMWTQWCQGYGLDPADARRSHVEQYRQELKAAGASVVTCAHKLSIVRRFYDAAIKHGLCEVNPAAGVRGGKNLTPREETIRALTEEALTAVLATVPTDSVSGLRDRVVLALMALQGLRSVEVWRLDHEHIERDAQGAIMRVRGKGHKGRSVPLRPDVLRAIDEYEAAKLKARFEVAGALIVGLGNNGRGERVSRRSLENIVNKYLMAAGVKREGVSCHGLRHTFATLALHNGAKIEYVRDEMGHSLLDTTMIYVRLLAKRDNSAATYIGTGLSFDGPADKKWE